MCACIFIIRYGKKDFQGNVNFNSYFNPQDSVSSGYLVQLLIQISYVEFYAYRNPKCP